MSPTDYLGLAAVTVVLVGALVWLAYGLAVGSAPLVATNVAGVCAATVCLAVALRLRRRASSSTQ